MPSRSCAHIRSNSLCPVPTTDSASEMIADPLGKMFCRCCRRSASGSARRSAAVQPDHVEGHIGGCPREAEKIIKLRAARFVGCDDLAVENCVAHIECGVNLVAEAGETAHQVAVARDQAAAPCSR